MATYRAPLLNNGPAIASDAGFGADVRFDPNDSAPDYIGTHVTQGAATSDSGWKILKFTYSGANVTRIQLAYGAWDSRASLF